MASLKFLRNRISSVKSTQIHLCVVLSSDRGLCGGFNTNICRKAKVYFEKILDEKKTLKIIVVGGKANDQLKRKYNQYIIDRITLKDEKVVSFGKAQEITDKNIINKEKNVLTFFISKVFSKC